MCPRDIRYIQCYETLTSAMGESFAPESRKSVAKRHIVITGRRFIMSEWVKLANLGSGLEADILRERLRGAGIQAETRGNDIVGIFGPGFQGTTARGVDVLVLRQDLAAAREILADDEDAPADE